MANITSIPIVSDNTITETEAQIKLNDYHVDPDTAWELANLVRIANTDFQCFDNWFNNKEKECKEFTLEEGRDLLDVEYKNTWIYASKKIDETILEQYTLIDENDSLTLEEIEKFSDENYYKYKILKTYEYVSYYPAKLRVDMDRFGFIAEREEKQEGGEIKRNIFVIFRGTREPAEWFSNAQFKHVNFLETEENSDGIIDFGKISLGFNKMYTGFRPGIFGKHENINIFSRLTDGKFRNLIEKVNNFQAKKQSICQAINDLFDKSPEYLKGKNVNFYISGHSLGGALATIATLHIAKKGLLVNQINLYTFASPRVGDNIFADKFNEFIKQDKIKAFRFANSEDIVPKIPFPVWFKLDINLEKNPALNLARDMFNRGTSDIFNQDYQHVGLPIYFTHQARRSNDDNSKKPTATIGDNHDLTRTYCGALKKQLLN